ncbi:MAG: MFS transporter, partial [Acidobacteriota bacterium]
FAAASFLNDMGSDIIYPIWPLFVTEVLKGNMVALGFLDGLGEALVSLSQAGSGYISDRIRKRKVFIWVGYLCGAVSRLGYALASLWLHLIPFRILDRMGKMRGAPRDAMVADLTPLERRGGTFGLLRAMDNLGAVCGILLCIGIVNVLGYRLIFALAAVPSIVGSLLILLFVREKKNQAGPIFKGLSLRQVSPEFSLYLVLSAIFALGAFSYSFLLIYAKTYGFNIALIPVLYLIFTAAASLFSIPFGRLSDLIGRRKVLFLAFLLWALVCAGMIAARSLFLFPFIFFVYGMHKGALEPIQKALVSDLAPIHLRASYLGGFQMVTGICALPASLIAGSIWEHGGALAPFYLSLGLTGISALLLIFVREKGPQS